MPRKIQARLTIYALRAVILAAMAVAMVVCIALGYLLLFAAFRVMLLIWFQWLPGGGLWTGLFATITLLVLGGWLMRVELPPLMARIVKFTDRLLDPVSDAIEAARRHA